MNDYLDFSDVKIAGLARIFCLYSPDYTCKYCCDNLKPPETKNDFKQLIDHFRSDCCKFKQFINHNYYKRYIRPTIDEKEIEKQGVIAMESFYKKHKCRTCSKNFRTIKDFKRHKCRCRKENHMYIEALPAVDNIKGLKTQYLDRQDGGELENIIVIESHYKKLMGGKWQQGVKKEKQRRVPPKVQFIVGYIEKEGEYERHYERVIIYKKDMRKYGNNSRHYLYATDYPCNYIQTSFRYYGKTVRKMLEYDPECIRVGPSRWEQAFQEEDKDCVEGFKLKTDRMIFELSYTEKLVLDQIWNEYKDIKK